MVKVQECVTRTAFATVANYESQLFFTLDLTRHPPKESHNRPSIVDIDSIIAKLNPKKIRGGFC
jgi:hypothetical protein